MAKTMIKPFFQPNQRRFNWSKFELSNTMEYIAMNL